MPDNNFQYSEETIEVIAKDIIDLQGEGAFARSKDNQQYLAVFKQSVFDDKSPHLALARPEMDGGMPLLEMAWPKKRGRNGYELLMAMCEKPDISTQLALLDVLMEDDEVAPYIESMRTGVQLPSGLLVASGA